MLENIADVVKSEHVPLDQLKQMRGVAMWMTELSDQ
jgi:hypothetical protein